MLLLLLSKIKHRIARYYTKLQQGFFRIFGCLLLISLTFSCSQQSFKPPKLTLPDNWGLNIDSEKNSFHISESNGSFNSNDLWWQSFAPPAMIQFRQQLLTSNIDLKKSELAIEKSELGLAQANASQRPSVGISTGVSHSYIKSSNGNSYSHGQSRGSGLSISYNLDYLLKNFDNSKIANRNMIATKIQYRAQKIQQEILLAQNYWQLMALMTQRRQQPLLIQLNEQKLGIQLARHKEGIISLIEVENARSTLQKLKLQNVDLQKRKFELTNNLNLLLGDTIKHKEYSVPELTLDTKVPIISPQIPATALANRPDVQLALINLHNLWQQHSTSYKLYFPDISLTTSSGIASLSLQQLISSPLSVAASIGAALSLNFFQQQLKQQGLEIDYKNARLDYEKTLFQALNETANALNDRVKLQNDAVLLMKNHQMAQTQLKIQKVRWKEGVIAKLDYIQAKISLIEAKQALTNNHLARLNQAMTVYKALGGMPSKILFKHQGS